MKYLYLFQFIAEDHDKLDIQAQCGNDRLLKLTGPSHGYETHAPSLMVKICAVRNDGYI